MMSWNLRVLIRERVTRYWQQQFRIWRTTLDWTIWLYFIVPGLLIAGGTYRDLWLNPPPWLTALPGGWMVLPLLLIVLNGHLRVFIEEADILFLRQRASWIRGLMAFGTVYSFSMNLLGTAFVLGLLSVWLVQAIRLGLADLAALLLYTAASRTIFSIAINLIYAYWKGWRRYARYAVAVMMMAAAYVPPVLWFLQERDASILQAAAAVSVAALAGAAAVKLHAGGTFMSDLQQERKAKLASAELLLSAVTERRPLVQLDKPLIFRRSGRLFRKTDAGTMLAEMRIKSFLRKWTSVRIWYSFFAVSTAAILLSPAWLGPALAAVLPLLAAGWIQEQWKEWLSEPFVRQFSWSSRDVRTGSSISRFWLIAPGAVWLGAAAGLMISGWSGALLGALCGLLYWYLLNKLQKLSI